MKAVFGVILVATAGPTSSAWPWSLGFSGGLYEFLEPNHLTHHEKRRLQGSCPAPQPQPSSTGSPMCKACGVIALEKADICRIDLSQCQQVLPGQSCEVRCRGEYSGSPTIASCPAGNTNPFRMLDWTRPDCSCPEPAAAQGYLKVGPLWQCAGNYASPQPSSTPTTVCSSDLECKTVTSGLQGCLPLRPCKVPNVDRCRYDVEACTNVEPGSSCTIRCRAPLVGDPPGSQATASCPDMNTNEDQELEYFPLHCKIEVCADPADTTGYNKTGGVWTCANGYSGRAVFVCLPSANWAYPSCVAEGVLSGCHPIVTCRMPVVSGMDVCKYDLSSCQGMEHNSSCEIFCISPPYTTAKSSFGYCPLGNTDKDGLQWDPPICEINCKEDPEIIPVGFTKNQDGIWVCEEDSGYTGFARKICNATPPSCVAVPILTGCSQVVPCQAPQVPCEYSIGLCQTVLPGHSCQIECKAPFVGDPGYTTANCPTGNSDPNGLQYTLPNCYVNSCADPDESPEGYKKDVFSSSAESKWNCAEGWTGVANKTCVKKGSTCHPQAEFNGCTKETTCKAMELNYEDTCVFNLSACSDVQAGTKCFIGCNAPFTGEPVEAHCPLGTTDIHTPLVWADKPPECGCIDPNPVPLGYTKTYQGVWECGSGYVGQAQKKCQPNDPFCLPEPVLIGCFLPMPCEVGAFVDEGSVAGFIIGHFNFGPVLVDTSGNGEDGVAGYSVFFVDNCNRTVGDAIAQIPKAETSFGCCRGDEYKADVNAKAPPGASGLLLVAKTVSGLAPDGRVIPFNSELMLRKVASSKAMRYTTGALALWLFLGVRLILLTTPQL